MRRTIRFVVELIATLGLLKFSRWFIDNLSFDTLIQFIDQRFGIKEATVMDWIIHNVIPLIPPALLVLILWRIHYRQPVQLIPASGPSERLDTVTLKSLTNSELKERAIAIANEMRTFEANFHANDRLISNQERMGQSGPPLTEIEARNRWVSEQQRDLVRRTAFETEYKTRYRPTARAMRNEVMNRLGLFGDSENINSRGSALDRAMPSGPDPVTRVADYLDELARKLP
jgi:hypothetical protein